MVEVDWRENLESWFTPILTTMGHKKRRMWGLVYL